MLRKVGIFVVLCCAIVLAQDDKGVQNVPTVDHDLSPTTTEVSTLAPTTSNATPSPVTNGTTTTPSPTNGTTPAPSPTNGTTPAPSPTNGTTPAPAPSNGTTPAPAPTNSTTPAPAPTTTEPVTTTTLAPPTKGHFIIKNGNDTCIIADLAAQIMLVMDKNETYQFDVPANASFNGTCNNETQTLSLTWVESSKTVYNLTLEFTKNDTAKKFMVSEIVLRVPLLNVTLNLTDYKPMFSASVKKSYRCEKQQEIKLIDEESNSTYAVLKISHLQLEAFHESGDDKFSAAEDCAGSNSTDIVPIAVGCALVSLIAIVLIAYLVGRRRSQARGYLSM